jgi:beta-N-acetylhexosaminidase
MKKTVKQTPKEKWIDDLMGKMTMEQKVGQLMVFGLCGTVITPDTVELIRKYHVGGIRISQGYRIITLFNDVKPGEQPDEMTLKSLHAPRGINRDPAYPGNPTRATAQEYAAMLNRLRHVSLDRKLGIPIHFTVDQEGSGSDDLLGGQRLFPHPMGLAASGDPKMVYRAAQVIARQARAVGANMIHSPVLDVNTNPLNPEIGTRAYSDNAADVAKYAMQTLKGFSEHKLMATGKHFPGRGESAADAHWGLPRVDLEHDRLMNEHISPYKALIAAGLPCVMTAHSVYPALGEDKLPASLTRRIVTDFLRGELGFKGVVTTDNMMMGGILKQYELAEACVMALIAGNDLVLCRDESPIRLKILQATMQAVKDGRLPESEVDEKVQRILAMRWDMGLARDGGLVKAEKAGAPINDPVVVKTAMEAAERSVLVMRDTQKALPVAAGKKVLLVEQVFPTHAQANNQYIHPGLLWDEMCAISESVGSVEIPNVPGANDKARIQRRLDSDEYDVIVTTNYYYHKAAAAIPDVVEMCRKTGRPVIVVTNTPYAFGADPSYPTVIVCFQPGGREHMRQVARLVFGKAKCRAKLPVKV